MDSTRRTRLFQKKKSTKQSIWNYMRRNIRFRVGDIMMILDIKDKTIKPIMRALEKAGYLRLESAGDAYKDRIYTFIKNTGIKSPSINGAEVYDHNTGEVFIPKLNKEAR